MKVESAMDDSNSSGDRTDGPSAIAADLLTHYERHARSLPWRSPPGTPAPDPYRVWLSEVMLQQTTVAAVIPYFEKFTTQWPDLAALAHADEADVMAAWAGLGYYSRARNLIACARTVMTEYDGVFPESAKALKALPGIGDYTSAAIAAIAFGEPIAAVDANVERVVARLFAITTPLPEAKHEIRARAQALVPAERPGDFAQAVMDLGATICATKKPQCLICPLLRDCAAAKAGIAETLPVKPAKKAKPERRGTAWWIEREGKVWLVTRPGKGMLGGMAALPDNGWRASGDGEGSPPVEAQWTVLNEAVRHGFTHFTVTLSVAMTQLGPGEADPDGKGRWYAIDDIDRAGLPTLFSKAAMLALAARQTSD